jgi:hypothetical protein
MHPLKQNLFLSKIQTQDNTYEINITTKTKKQLFFNKANKLLDYSFMIPIKKGIHSNHPHIPLINNIFKIYIIIFLFLL